MTEQLNKSKKSFQNQIGCSSPNFQTGMWIFKAFRSRKNNGFAQSIYFLFSIFLEKKSKESRRKNKLNSFKEIKFFSSLSRKQNVTMWAKREAGKRKRKFPGENLNSRSPNPSLRLWILGFNTEYGSYIRKESRALFPFDLDTCCNACLIPPKWSEKGCSCACEPGFTAKSTDNTPAGPPDTCQVRPFSAWGHYHKRHTLSTGCSSNPK